MQLGTCAVISRITFAGAETGAWRVASLAPVRGAALPNVPYLDVSSADERKSTAAAAWKLHGLISNLRYATRAELADLRAVQEPLGRLHATRAALIPIKKTAAWWGLAQDERRAIFEEQSRHNGIGRDFLPAIARQLYHARDLGEPFDFLTWFEYAPEHAHQFEDLVGRLRRTLEWTFVEREVDIRLERD